VPELVTTLRTGPGYRLKTAEVTFMDWISVALATFGGVIGAWIATVIVGRGTTVLSRSSP
jgi:hypothetical protein